MSLQFPETASEVVVAATDVVVAATVVVVDGIVLVVKVTVVPDVTVVLVSGAALVLVARLDVVVDETGSSSFATRNATVPTTTTKRPDRIQAVRF
jgi:hypothetical protein